MATTAQLQNAVVIAQRQHNNAVAALAAAQAVIDKVNSQGIAPTAAQLAALQSAQQLTNAASTTVKSTQMDLNSAKNNLSVAQGTTGPAVSPAINPIPKQQPYNVPQPSPNSGTLLNSPTGLIVGATALAAVTRNPNLISGITSGIGKIFDNSKDLLSSSLLVPKSAASVPNPYGTDLATQGQDLVNASTPDNPSTEDPLAAAIANAEGEQQYVESTNNGVNTTFDPSQFPAYDDQTGELNAGFAINPETGETYYQGFGETTAADAVGDQDPVAAAIANAEAQQQFVESTSTTVPDAEALAAFDELPPVTSTSTTLTEAETAALFDNPTNTFPVITSTSTTLSDADTAALFGESTPTAELVQAQDFGTDADPLAEQLALQAQEQATIEEQALNNRLDAAVALDAAQDEGIQTAINAQDAQDLIDASSPEAVIDDPLAEQLALQAQEQAAIEEQAFNDRLDAAVAVDAAQDEGIQTAINAQDAQDLIDASSPEAVDNTAVDNAEVGQQVQAGEINLGPDPQPNPYNTPLDEQGRDLTDAAAEGAKSVNAGVTRAKNASTLQTRYAQPTAADWRVRLQLAPGADYLYKSTASRDAAGNVTGGPGILAPLYDTDGVIFPYTPTISTSYNAKYDPYDLIHSNYRGYFYKSSQVETISIKGTFTAQDSTEAAYLLAVIHFFRSVTKMFYGQDQQAGTPPPLVFLSGLGQYQFNNHACVVSQFSYNLPNDVDYIRADGFNNIGLNMENRRNQSSGPAPGGSLGTAMSVINRLTNSGLKSGGLSSVPSPSQVNKNVSNQTPTNSTYVPTKMEIDISLYPMQTRDQVSKLFSLKSYANGDLLQGGFW